MGVISVAGISYGDWFKWAWKPTVILLALGALFLAVSPLGAA